MAWDVDVSGDDELIAELDRLADTSFDQRVVVSRVEYAVYVEFGTKYMDANAGLRQSVTRTMSNLDDVVDGAETVDEMMQLIAEDIRDGWQRRVWVDTGTLQNSIHIEEV